MTTKEERARIEALAHDYGARMVATLPDNIDGRAFAGAIGGMIISLVRQSPDPHAALRELFDGARRTLIRSGIQDNGTGTMQ